MAFPGRLLGITSPRGPEMSFKEFLLQAQGRHRSPWHCPQFSWLSSNPRSCSGCGTSAEYRCSSTIYGNSQTLTFQRISSTLLSTAASAALVRRRGHTPSLWDDLVQSPKSKMQFSSKSRGEGEGRGEEGMVRWVGCSGLA